MAKFPVEHGDPQGVIDAINYALSGPSGLGQNFAGFSTSKRGYQTPNFRLPYARITNTPIPMYVAPIPISTAEAMDPRTYRYTFTAAQPTAPFTPGSIMSASGFTDDFYDGTYASPGVVYCSTTEVVVKTDSAYNNPGPDTSGTGVVSLSTMDGEFSTDCNAQVVVTGPTDRVFINAQLRNVASYTSTRDANNAKYVVTVDRLKAQFSHNPFDPDYFFSRQVNVANVIYDLVITPNVTPTELPELNTIFTSIIDIPDKGFYWYLINTALYANDGVITAASGTGATATLTFEEGPIYNIGQTVDIVDMDPAAYDGTFVLTGATATTISYASAATGALATEDAYISESDIELIYNEMGYRSLSTQVVKE